MALVPGTTKYGDINQRTAAYAAVKMLRHAAPFIVLGGMGTSMPMPKNKADTVKFRRAISFPAATTPLLEGVTPSPQKMQYEDVVAQLKQYGATTEITDVVEDLSEDPVLMNVSELLGEQAALTIEMLTYGVVKAGTSVFYSNGTVRTAVNTAMTLAKQRAVMRFLQAQKARMITKGLSGSPDYKTSPIEAAYVAVGHTDLNADIRNMAGFVPADLYGTKSKIAEGEIGSVEGVRYVLSPELFSFADAGGAAGGNFMSLSGTNSDVYPLIFLGQDAFATIPLKGEEAITPMVVNMKPSASDPLAQRGYVSFKTYFVAVILNQNWMARVEVAATKL